MAIDFSQVSTLEAGVVEKLKSLAAMADTMLPLAKELEIPLELLFPASTPAFTLLNELSTGVGLIDKIAPNFEGNVSALKAAAQPVIADVEAIKAELEAILRPSQTAAATSSTTAAAA